MERSASTFAGKALAKLESMVAKLSCKIVAKDFAIVSHFLLVDACDEVTKTKQKLFSYGGGVLSNALSQTPSTLGSIGQIKSESNDFPGANAMTNDRGGGQR